MGAKLELHLLGPLRIVRDGQVVTDTLPVKAQALLCYLAVTGEVHTRHALAGLFWGDVPEAKAKNSLRVTLASLRKLCSDHLSITHQTIAFNQDSDVWLDVAAFAAGLGAEIDTAVLQNTIQLYRADFLAEFAIEGAIAFDEWLLARRAYWQQQALLALDRLTTEWLAQRAYPEAIKTLQRRLTLEPWHEEAHRQLMLAFSRTGDYSRALAQYQTCCWLLEQELGVEPMPETTDLFDRIQVARQQRAYPLPADDTPFIGRQLELQRLHHMLTKPDARLVTITGYGGIGKTRLALAAARQLNQEQAITFLNGVLFVALQDVKTVDRLPLALADALHAPLSGGNDPVTGLAKYLRQKEMLIVLDNFEHLLPPDTQPGTHPPASITLLNQILNHCPEVKLLVTSRRPLQMGVEWRLDIEGLDYPLAGPPPESEQRSATAVYPAAQLFVQSAQQVRPDYELTAADALHVYELCRLVAGMPLAIRLAAAWLRSMSLEAIVIAVKSNLDILSSQMHDLPPRQRSIRAIFDATWEAMTEKEQALLADLSVFRGGFTAVAAQNVATATPHLLAGIKDRGLLQLDHQPSGSRYMLHELVRQYAAQKQTTSAQAEAPIQKHAAYFAHFVARHAPALTGSEPATAAAQLRRELDNIRLAWQTAVNQQAFELLDAMAEPLGLFYLGESMYLEGINQFQMAAESISEARRAAKEQSGLLGTLWGWLGRLHAAYQPDTQATFYFRQQLALAQRTDHTLNLATAHLGLGRVDIEESKFDEALTHAQTALDLFQQAGQTRGVIEALAMLGIPYAARDDLTKAENYYSRAVATGRQAGDVRATLPPLINLAYAATNDGRYTQAIALFREALLLVEQSGLQSELGRLHYLFGRAAAFRGDYDEAWNYFERSRIAYAQEGRRFLVAKSDRWLGRLHQIRGDIDQARRVLQQALNVHRHLEHASSIEIDLSHLGLTEEAAGDLELATRYFQEAVTLERETGRGEGSVFNLANLARVLVKRGQLDEARDCLHEACRRVMTRPIGRQTLHLFAGVAAYLIAAGDGEAALPLLIYTCTHPATTAETRTRAQTLLDEQTAVFDTQSIQKAQHQAETATAESLLTAVLSYVTD